MIQFAQNERLPNVSKSITNSKEISRTLKFAKFRTLRMKHFEQTVNQSIPITITTQVMLFFYSKTSSRTPSVGESASLQTTRRPRVSEKHAPIWVLVIGLRNALRRSKSRSVKCRHRNANSIQIPFADLPREWLVEHVLLFIHVGVD